MRKVLKVKPPHADAAAPVAPGPLERWRDPATALPEWYLPSSRPDRYLAMHNLRRRADSAARRLELAARYHRNLDGVAGVGRPPVSLSPLSCYTVRVGPEARRAVYECLWKTGIAATVLFEFLPYLNRQEFPHAWRAASEVLNLPLFESLRLADVDWISEQMARCASRD
jgi:dTDP-4-amino-4,6-dideoxygalactose transaminase